MGRLGVFGGTFDPPHLGHLILAAEAQHQLRLDRLLWVLTPDPPHKQGQVITPLADRLVMLWAAISGAPAFELSRVEIDRPGPHFALETMTILARDNPGAELVYLIGGDSLRDLPSWRRATELVAVCHALGVMRRPGAALDLVALDQLLPGLAAKVQFIDAPLLDISASDIRQRVAEGRPYRFFLPPEVYAIIQKRGLYQAE